MEKHVSRQYQKPVVQDLGDLEAITQASGFTNLEDGGSKLLIHHEPSAPAGP
jgi:hypothetical protein